MADYAYTAVTGKLKSLLDKVRKIGVPPKVTVAWLKTIGYTSSNDVSLIGVLKFVKLADASGVPTSIWTAYRGANHKVILADAIRQGYADLFAIYPDANVRTNAELTHVFSTSSTAGAQVISKTVLTFKALVEEADFQTASVGSSELSLPAGPLHTPAAGDPPKQADTTASASPEVHIDIQIHISPESTSEQIDKIFESMSKHLYGRKA